MDEEEEHDAPPVQYAATKAAKITEVASKTWLFMEEEDQITLDRQASQQPFSQHPDLATVVEGVVALKSAATQIIMNQECLLDREVEHPEFAIIVVDVGDLKFTLETLLKNLEAWSVDRWNIQNILQSLQT